MPVARKLQENFAIFSHDGQEPDEEGTKLPKRYLS
jgi:hypothetical protein